MKELLGRGEAESNARRFSQPDLHDFSKTQPADYSKHQAVHTVSQTDESPYVDYTDNKREFTPLADRSRPSSSFQKQGRGSTMLKNTLLVRRQQQDDQASDQSKNELPRRGKSMIALSHAKDGNER